MHVEENNCRGSVASDGKTVQAGWELCKVVKQFTYGLKEWQQVDEFQEAKTDISGIEMTEFANRFCGRKGSKGS